MTEIKPLIGMCRQRHIYVKHRNLVAYFYTIIMLVLFAQILQMIVFGTNKTAKSK